MVVVLVCGGCFVYGPGVVLLLCCVAADVDVACRLWLLWVLMKEV